MSKAKNVVECYVLCNKLKDVIRTGWQTWHVKRERLESVAEHVYGVQMLAMLMHSEYQYDIDIMKVISMLAVHELEETVIGDLTQFEITDKDKAKIGHEAVCNLLDGLLNKDKIMNLVLEFDERKTSEAKFAYYCDKLECDIQSKLYDEEGCVDLDNQDGNKVMNDSRVQSLLNTGKSWSEMWLFFGQAVYNYDKNFTEVSNYVKDHKIKRKNKIHS